MLDRALNTGEASVDFRLCCLDTILMVLLLVKISVRAHEVLFTDFGLELLRKVVPQHEQWPVILAQLLRFFAHGLQHELLLGCHLVLWHLCQFGSRLFLGAMALTHQLVYCLF